MIVDEVQWVVGVDTHVDTHTAALCDVRGRPLAERRVQTTPAGYAEMAAWARAAAGDAAVVWAVEGTRHYGLGLSRFLAGQGQRVVEIDRSRHVGKRRAGKSDPIVRVQPHMSFSVRPDV
ncbi:MAG TPA: transposase [Propionibacteriaceae bacterium]|nr:transposase [Propionibacteriaceae bacterium]